MSDSPEAVFGLEDVAREAAELVCEVCGATHDAHGEPFKSRRSVGMHKRIHTLSASADPTPPEADEPTEQIPNRKRRPLDRLRDHWRREPRPGGGERVPRRPKPARRAGRTSLAPAVSLGWAGAAMGISRSSPPVGRAMQLQIPIAGDVVDRAVQGTLLDKIIQPLAGDAEKYGDLANLAAFPMAVYLYDKYRAPMVMQLLRMIVANNLQQMNKALETARSMEAEVAQVAQSLGLPPGEDPVEQILAGIFAPVPEASPTPPPASGNGQPVTSPFESFAAPFTE